MRRGTVILDSDGRQTPIAAEIAANDKERALGLMYRTELAADAGMLFVYDGPQEIHMWMRNTYIPLDMVFIGADQRVHRIASDAEPFSERIIASEGPVTAVLELNAGTAERLGLKPGDTVELPPEARLGAN
ncbi:MAG: DUF192 domain-containing protein [Hyphomicrobiaceae bacterium]